MRRFLKSLLVITLMFVGGALLNAHASAATPSGCDDYAIMRCGATSHQQFINKVKANAPGDLKAIYADYGLTQADYGKFVSDAKTGTLHEDGRIVVDGRVVGRSTQNVGRVHDSNFNQRVNINGKTYWGGPFSSTHHANQAEVMVLMKNGKLQFAAISSCGNPQRFTTPPNEPEEPEPEYQCKLITPAPVTDKKNTYRFTTQAPVSGGAEVVSVTYDFGDGTKETVSRPGQAVEHTFTRSSRVRATVQVRLPNGDTKQVSSINCVTRIVVTNTPPPPPENPQGSAYCSAFKTPELINEDQRLYRFTVVANTSNATFVRAEFKFSDSPTAVMPALPNGNEATINHAFPQQGNYTVEATLYFNEQSGGSISSSCRAQVTATDKPVLTDCQSDGTSGKGCEELTATGPGAIVAGVFGGAGTIAAVGHYIVRRRLLGL